MKQFQEYFIPASTWEHLIPFLLMLTVINGYLSLTVRPVWSILQASEFGFFGTVGVLLIIFLATNLFCLMGYALSRICILAFRTALHQLVER